MSGNTTSGARGLRAAEAPLVAHGRGARSGIERLDLDDDGDGTGTVFLRDVWAPLPTLDYPTVEGSPPGA